MSFPPGQGSYTPQRGIAHLRRAARRDGRIALALRQLRVAQERGGATVDAAYLVLAEAAPEYAGEVLLYSRVDATIVARSLPFAETAARRPQERDEKSS